MNTYILWTLAASLLGLLITVIGVSVLHLRRTVFLLVYVPLVGLFLYIYLRWANINVGELLQRNWLWGAAVGILVSIILVRNVLSQPATPRSEGCADRDRGSR